MKRYNPAEIEQKWQQKWEEDGTYAVDISDHSKPKYYGFGMLPGITGAGIHIGHGRTYQFADIKVRAKRQQGYNAYNPIGWDSFGLPVENYAIKVGKTPREAHNEAKANFVLQLKRLGFSYDWSKEISTADPSYYKWTQWIFSQLYKNGLAYQKESPQWWCETDQTVLANEQVEGGKCWRCGNVVTKKNLKQWFFKITEYADEMLEATDDLNWSEQVKTMQKNWIGKSQGAEIDFQLYFDNEEFDNWRDEDGKPAHVTVFTTRPDTLFGATFLVLAPEHPWVTAALQRPNLLPAMENVQEYVNQALSKSEVERMNENREKTGVFTGVHAINPATGEKIPVWVADYVLAGYGTGAIMAVPGHDERDFAFAEAFTISVKIVVEPEFGTPHPDETNKNAIIAIVRNPKTKEVLVLDWGKRKEKHGGTIFIGGGMEEGEDPVETAKREILEETGYVNVEHVANAQAWVNNHFYSNVKDKHVYARFLPILFELVDEEQVSQNLDENENQFSLKWVPEDNVHEIIDDPAHLHGYTMFQSPYLYDGEGVLVNSGTFDGMRTEEAREEIVAWLEQQGVGRIKTTYKMRDWLISRQRYWGAPIPIVHVEGHGAVAVPDSQLPVILPEVEDFKPKGGATSVLATIEDWVHVWYNLETGETVPFSQGRPEGDPWKEGHRETDTLDGYACSSWYFLRYLDPFNEEKAWDPKIEAHWGPVDFYNGADHAVAHLLYARFWMRFFYKQGLVSHPEPFKRMMYNAYIMAPDGRKMSKSLGNVIDPMEIMNSGYGADSLRLYEMFIAPFDMEAPWDTRGVPGTYRFLNRVWNLVQEYLEAEVNLIDEKTARSILEIAHKTAKKVTQDIEDEKFNTAIAAMMEAVNSYYKLKEAHSIGKNDAWKFAIESLLQVLAPFAPHITEELWYQLGHEKTIHIDEWPKWDDRYLVSDKTTIIVQVNGKMRAKFEASADMDEEAIKVRALQEDSIQKYTDKTSIKRVIYVPGRLINILL